MARSTYSLGEHLLNGRLNFSTDLVSAHIISTAYTADMFTAIRTGKSYLSDMPSGHLSYEIPRVTVAGTISRDLTGEDPVVKVVVPDLTFTNTNAYPAYAFGILFFKDTGTPATSPLIGYDDIGSVVFVENLSYTYKSSTDGLIQLALP